MNAVKKLGMGMMRLPQVDGEIDLATTIQMADRFLEAGGVWFDTAWGYHNGTSEAAVRDAVTARHPREAFKLATKLPVWLVKAEGDAEPLLQEQLRRTGARYFDRYMLHSLSDERLSALDEFGVWAFLASVKARGLAKSVGFSFHDTADVLERILSAHPDVDFVQLQINYLDWEDERVQSRRCYEVARAHGVDVIIMEPVKGGMLSKLPDEAAEPLRALHPDWSDARWALAFCLSLEGVSTILSGMSEPGHVDDNLITFGAFEPLGAPERAALDECVARLKAMPSIACTACGYCVEHCPQKIKIPDIFETATSVMRFGPRPSLIGHYRWLVEGGSGRASECIACQACEPYCPQHLEIKNLMADCAAILE